MIGSPVAVVCLPSSYRDHPLLWITLAHEIAGHQWIHSAPGFSEWLTMGIQRLVAEEAPVPDRATRAAFADVWRHWAEEAAADVLGVLSLGPAFGVALIAWLAALRARSEGVQEPYLLTSSVAAPGKTLDTHPADLLRLYLIQGAIERMNEIQQSTRRRYIGLLSGAGCTALYDVGSMRVRGAIRRTSAEPVEHCLEIPLVLAAETARMIGRWIATERMRRAEEPSGKAAALWSDSDETAACKLSKSLRRGCSVTAGVRHLLAAAVLAVEEQPGTYDLITSRVAAALDELASRMHPWAFAEG
jgi:hypothetical protein